MGNILYQLFLSTRERVCATAIFCAIIGLAAILETEFPGIIGKIASGATLSAVSPWILMALLWGSFLFLLGYVILVIGMAIALFKSYSQG